jgi:flagellar basal-body rod modification protein FlgD
MAIDTTSAVGSTTNNASRTRMADNFEMFLSLLTTQMKNQDPLSPMDSNQFTQQLTQMTGVEQQLLTNDLLQTLVNNSNRGISEAVGLIGKEVRAVGNTTVMKNGEAEWVYKLDRSASNVTLEVLDANGKVAATIYPTENAAGDHVFNWDGKDPTSGERATAGTFILRVTATDAGGSTVPYTTYQQGRVTSVEQSNGSTLITVNGTKMAWDTVTSITEAEQTPTT